jgi:hypothetical protein
MLRRLAAMFGPECSIAVHEVATMVYKLLISADEPVMKVAQSGS